MTDCTCGYGGFHEPENRRCEAFDPALAMPAPTADPVDLRDGTRPWDEARAPEIDALAKVLHAAWREAEPNSLVSLYSASYLATFADMARAILPLIDAERAARETAEGRITALRLDTEKRAAEYERTLTRYGSAVEPGSRNEYTEGQIDGLRYALRALGVTP